MESRSCKPNNVMASRCGKLTSVFGSWELTSLLLWKVKVLDSANYRMIRNQTPHFPRRIAVLAKKLLADFLSRELQDQRCVLFGSSQLMVVC